MGNDDMDATATTEVDEESVSALRANIARKGNNSYYYAHGHKVDGPEWDGKEEPRLLATVPLTEKARKVRPIESYGWMDGKSTVKVIIDWEGADSIAEEDLILTSTDNSIDFRVTSEGIDHALHISPFHATVESATLKTKSSKFVILLKRATTAPWYQLTNKS